MHCRKSGHAVWELITWQILRIAVIVRSSSVQWAKGQLDAYAWPPHA